MSHSENKSPSTQTMTDNRMVLGEGANYATGGSTINNYSLDASALNDAYAFGGAAMQGAGSFAVRSLDSVDETTGRAFDFGGDVVGAALNFADSVVGGALDSNNNALTQAFNFGSDALALTESSVDRVLDYSAAITDRNFGQTQSTLKLVADAYNDAKGRGALTDKIIIGAIIAVSVVAFVAVRRKG